MYHPLLIFCSYSAHLYLISGQCEVSSGSFQLLDDHLLLCLSALSVTPLIVKVVLVYRHLSPNKSSQIIYITASPCSQKLNIVEYFFIYHATYFIHKNRPEHTVFIHLNNVPVVLTLVSRCCLHHFVQHTSWTVNQKGRISNLVICTSVISTSATLERHCKRYPCCITYRKASALLCQSLDYFPLLVQLLLQ